MKKLTTIILTVLLLTGAFYLGRTTAGADKQTTNKIEVIGVYTDIETATANNFYIDDNEIVTEYSDGSYTIVNEKENYYMFQPSVLGDWQLDNFNTIEQLNNCVKTYISIQQTGSY